MKKVFFAVAAVLLVVSACKKDNNVDFAKQLLIGNWNQVDITSKIPTGKYLKLNDNGSMESTVFTNYNAYEVKNNQLVLKGSAGTVSAAFSVSSDSLYIEPNAACQGNDCSTLFAKQK